MFISPNESAREPAIQTPGVGPRRCASGVRADAVYPLRAPARRRIARIAASEQNDVFQDARRVAFTLAQLPEVRTLKSRALEPPSD